MTASTRLANPSPMLTWRPSTSPTTTFAQPGITPYAHEQPRLQTRSLRAQGGNLFFDGPYPESFGQPVGRMAEEYYNALLKRESPPEPDGPAAGQCGGAATGVLAD